jgi:hypothetical protein
MSVMRFTSGQHEQYLQEPLDFFRRKRFRALPKIFLPRRLRVTLNRTIS